MIDNLVLDKGSMWEWVNGPVWYVGMGLIGILGIVCIHNGSPAFDRDNFPSLSAPLRSEPAERGRRSELLLVVKVASGAARTAITRYMLTWEDLHGSLSELCRIKRSM